MIVHKILFCVIMLFLNSYLYPCDVLTNENASLTIPKKLPEIVSCLEKTIENPSITNNLKFSCFVQLTKLNKDPSYLYDALKLDLEKSKQQEAFDILKSFEKYGAERIVRYNRAQKYIAEGKLEECEYVYMVQGFYNIDLYDLEKKEWNAKKKNEMTSGGNNSFSALFKKQFQENIDFLHLKLELAQMNESKYLRLEKILLSITNRATDDPTYILPRIVKWENILSLGLMNFQMFLDTIKCVQTLTPIERDILIDSITFELCKRNKELSVEQQGNLICNMAQLYKLISIHYNLLPLYNKLVIFGKINFNNAGNKIFGSKQ